MLKQTGSGETRASDDDAADDDDKSAGSRFAAAAAAAVLLFDSKGCNRLTEDVVVAGRRRAVAVVVAMQLHNFVSCDEAETADESRGKGVFPFATFGDSFSFSSSEQDDRRADISE